jgi:hypothetical protein
MNSARYRLYREHKYVSFMLSSFRTEVAKIDFSLNEGVNRIKETLSEITALMHGHALHENDSIHALLRNKNSLVHEKIEADHDTHEDTFEKLNQLLSTILEETDVVRKVDLGHQFYLEFQRFEAENLLHQIYEETVIMPELQRLYTDEELLKAIDAKTYEIMTPEHMIHMMQILFPHMNADDRAFFLNDIYRSEPTKFIDAWRGVSPMMDPLEREELVVRFNLQ